MWKLVGIFLCMVGCTFGVNTPPLPGNVNILTPPPFNVGRSSNSGSYDLSCVDKLPNCESFGEASCKDPYAAWAKVNCNATCKFCTPPPTSPSPCVDKLDNCDTYTKETCSDEKYKGWAKENCRATCNMCAPGQVPPTTTIDPANCIDKVDCRLYGKTSCTGQYAGWAKNNCPVFCQICTGLATPPPKCEDAIPNCLAYDLAMCGNPDYRIWAEDNCSKYCGFCGGSSANTKTGAPTAAVATPPPIKTPPPITG